SLTAVRLTGEVLGWLHGTHDPQPVLRGEVPVALVLTGHGHHRAGAVVGQDIVGDKDRDLFSADRVHRVRTEEHASFLPCLLTVHRRFLRGGVAVLRNGLHRRRRSTTPTLV